MSFEEDHEQLFMGGRFNLERPKSVGILRAVLKEMDDELAGWGDEKEIGEFHLRQETQEIEVTLKEGIPQGIR